MAKIIIESSIPYMRGVAERYAEVEYVDNESFSPERIAGADALLIRSITHSGAPLLGGGSVRFVATATAGIDHIDTAYCDSVGIGYANAKGCNATAVAQWVMSSLSWLSLREGFALEERTLGIVGVGCVGREVLRLATAMGMSTLLCDPPRAEQEGSDGFVSLEELQRHSDIITLHVPLTREGRYPTRGMVDDAFVAQCLEGTILVNACRGGVTDTGALIRGHRSGRLSHLLIDCWEGEPHISQELLSIATIATPHIAGFSADGKHRGARMALLAISDYLSLGANASILEPIELATPAAPLIHLEQYPPTERLRRAMLHTYSPEAIDALLRSGTVPFETMRKTYDYPREMTAYSIVGGSSEERQALAMMGFLIDSTEEASFATC